MSRLLDQAVPLVESLLELRGGESMRLDPRGRIAQEQREPIEQAFREILSYNDDVDVAPQVEVAARNGSHDNGDLDIEATLQLVD
jgi:hypothetical protein